MAAKHSPSKAQQFGGDSQLPETLEFSLVILKQFSPSFQSRLLADLTNGFSLPEAESSFYYCFVYEPPWVSTSSPVLGLKLQQIASSSPSPSSCGKLLSSTYSPQSVPNKTQLSCEHRWQEASCPFPSSLDCKSWEYLFDWGDFFCDLCWVPRMDTGIYPPARGCSQSHRLWVLQHFQLSK